ncbi:MAG: hypothetical protein LBT70_00040 [Holosporaceae bacterium]|nr:hypothetical protein [Holosporaceae bacterium]
MPNEVFLARRRKNVAQDCSVLAAHEDLSNGFDQIEGGKAIRQQSQGWRKSMRIT